MALLERLLPTAGDVLAGRYELRQELNRGSVGVIYTARQQGLDEPVVIKILMPHVVTNDDMVKRFEREIALAKGLRHPNTIRILDVGRTEHSLPFYVMEHVPGQTLRQLLRDEGAISPRGAQIICIQLLKSLSEAHAKGIVHRDLKPGNLLLCDIHGAQDFVKVLDFGVAKATAGDLDDMMTHTGVVIGTPAYMSPEQARGARDVDQRSDIYSVGLILAECLIGRKALDVQTLYDAITLHSLPQPPPLPDDIGGSGLRAVIERALQTDRDDRYQSADAFCQALSNLEGLSRVAKVFLQRPREDTPITLPATPWPLVKAQSSSVPEASVEDLTDVYVKEMKRRNRWLPLALLCSIGFLGLVVMLRITLPSGDTDEVIGAAAASATSDPVSEDEPPVVEPQPSTEEVSSALRQAQLNIGGSLPPVRVFSFDGTRGAAVTLDGQLLGELPFDLDVPRLAAAVEVHVSRLGYHSLRQVVVLDNETIQIDLERRQPREAAESSGTAAELPFGQMGIFPQSRP